MGGNFPLAHKQLTTDEIVAVSAAEQKKRTHVMARYNSTPRSRAAAKAYVSVLWCLRRGDTWRICSCECPHVSEFESPWCDIGAETHVGKCYYAHQRQTKECGAELMGKSSLPMMGHKNNIFPIYIGVLAEIVQSHLSIYTKFFSSEKFMILLKRQR